MGTPSKDYHVQVDTGSDLLWLNCNPCTACAISNNLGVGKLPKNSQFMIYFPYVAKWFNFLFLLQMNIESFDPHLSLNSSLISCEDPICASGSKIVNTNCYEDNYCGYSFQYGDKSSTTGYLVEDTFVYRTIQPNKSLSNADARIVFG